MQAIVFVAAFAACIVGAWAILYFIEAREGRHVRNRPVTFAHFADRQITTWTRPVLYDWAERGDFS